MLTTDQEAAQPGTKAWLKANLDEIIMLSGKDRMGLSLPTWTLPMAPLGVNMMGQIYDIELFTKWVNEE